MKNTPHSGFKLFPFSALKRIVLPAMGALVISFGMISCDSTKEVMNDDDPVEVSENTVTDPDTTNTTK